MSDASTISALIDKSSWQRASLGKLLPLKYGKSLPAQLRDANGSHPVYGSSGMVGTHSAALTNGPTLIVGRKGNVGAIHYSTVPCWSIDTAYFVQAPAGHNLLYYKYLLESLNLRRLDRSTAIPGLSRDDYNAIEVVIAPMHQQDEIVAELEKQFSRLDEAVAKLQRVKANLKRYKASVLKAAVEGRLVETEASIAHREGRSYETGQQLLQVALVARRSKWDRRGRYDEPKPADLESLQRVPEGWAWANVEQLGFVRGGKRLPSGHKYSDEPTPYPYVRVTDFTDYGVDPCALLYLKAETQSEIRRYTISSDDVYISIAGSIGLVGIVPKHLSGANLTENAAKITGLEQVSKKYLVYWLSSASGVGFISDSTIATTQAKLALYRIERIPVPLPPRAEQARIVAEVDRHLSIVREVEAEVDTNLKRAQALRQSVLARCFSTGLRSTKL